MKAVIYARVSTADGSQNADSQLLILKDMALKMGYEVVEEYVDQMTGGTLDRPAFQRMMADLERLKGKRIVLFFALDRLSREGALKTLQVLERITALGHEYHSYTEAYLTSLGPFREAIIALMATLAKQEKLRIQERTRAGLARVRVEGSRSGKPIGRPRVDFDEEAGRRLLSEGKSLRKAAEALGVPLGTFRLRMKGRHVKKVPAVWSEPVWGVVEEELFRESEAGPIVVRYDLSTGLAHCMNHRGLLTECISKHESEGA